MKIGVGYSMFCVDYGIFYYINVYFITTTKHYISYLSLTQPFPVLLTSRFHIVKYTHYVAFHLVVCHFFLAMGAFSSDKWILLAELGLECAFCFPKLSEAFQ